MTLNHYCPLMSIGAVAAGNNRLVDCMGSLCELWVKSPTYSEKKDRMLQLGGLHA